MKTVDARGLSCPEPVILARRTVNALKPDDQAVILIDSKAARDNVLRALRSLGCDAAADENEGGFQIHITKK